MPQHNSYPAPHSISGCAAGASHLAVGDELPEAYLVDLHHPDPVCLPAGAGHRRKPQPLLEGDLGWDQTGHRHAHACIVTKELHRNLRMADERVGGLAVFRHSSAGDDSMTQGWQPT